MFITNTDSACSLVMCIIMIWQQLNEIKYEMSLLSAVRLLQCPWHYLFVKNWEELIQGCPFRHYSMKVILRNFNFSCNPEFCILGSSSVIFINFCFPRKISLLERRIHIHCHVIAFYVYKLLCICGYIFFLLIIPCASSLVL